MKEAVVFILDSNDSMKKPQDGKGKSRFDCAKQVALDMISDLMIRSKTHEVVVILLKTLATNHHYGCDPEDDDDDDDDDDENDAELPFPNITELGGSGEGHGLCRPSADLLRAIQKLQPTEDTSDVQGDFIDGIIVGADALFRATASKKYQRRIVLITDAEHRIECDQKQLLVVLDNIRAMECRLEVIGLDFESQGEYAHAASASTAKPVKVKQEQDDDGLDEQPQKEKSMEVDGNNDSETDVSVKDADDSVTDVSDNENGGNDDEDDDDDENEDEDEQEIDTGLIKSQNEQLLLGLTEKTGGYVMSAKELQPILQKLLGSRIAKSTRRKVEFQIAPGLVLDVRSSNLMTKTAAPRLTKQVAMMDPENPNQTRVNALGQDMTSEFRTEVSHWDPEKEEREVLETARAYRYGSDLIPMGDFDMFGLTKPSPVKITILGYLPETQVPRELRIGPPVALTGADSRRACAGISALARGLRKTKQVAIANFVKSRDGDPILVGIFPLEQGNDPIHLVVMQIPFRGDVPRNNLPPFDKDNNNGTSKACDDMIDSLMLPQDTLDHTKISNPFIRSFHKTIVQRVLDPDSPVVSVRSEDLLDPMATPPHILQSAKPAMDAFRKAFPLTKNVANGKDGKRRKGPATYRDFIENSDGSDTE